MDKEEIIKGLEHCSDRTQKRCNRTCPYHDRFFCESELALDALTLLKEYQSNSGCETYATAVEGGAQRMREYIWQDSDDGYISERKQEIVRCMDCKFWKSRVARDENPSWLPCMAVPTRNDFFCADGVRKDE